jgi:hypothetical protein
MSNKATANLGTGGEDFVGFRETVNGPFWPGNAVAYALAGTDNNWSFQVVDSTHGLPVSVIGNVPVTGTFWPTTQPVSAVALPLPAGAATAARQDDAKAVLDTINTFAANLVGIAGNISVIESSFAPLFDDLNIIGGYIDSLESLIGTTNTKLTSIDGKITACNTGAVVISAALPAGTNVLGHIIVDSGTVAATQSGTWNITNVSGTISLPTGASTAANQTTANTSLASIDGKLATAKTADYDTGGGVDTVQLLGIALPKSGGAVAGGTSADPIRTDPTGTTTQPVSGTVSISSSVLPTGAATLAAQTTGNASLTSIDGKVTACNTGAVVISSSALPTGASTAANQTTGNTSLSSIDGKLVTAKTQDFDTGAGTDTVQVFGIMLPGNGGSVVGGTSAAPFRTDPTGTTTQPVSGTVSASQSGAWNITNVSGTVSLPTGASTEATLSALNTKVTACNTGAVVIASGTLAATQSGTWTVGISAAQTIAVTNAGTFAAQAAQAGTWTVQPGNTPNTSPWLANHKDPAATTGTITAADVGSTSVTNNLGQVAVTGAATANSTVPCTLAGHGAVTLQISGTASLTFTVERSIDGGTTWTTFKMEEIGLGATTLTTLAISDNRPYLFRGDVGGVTNVRIRCTAYTSGTLSVNWQPSYPVTQLPVAQGPPNSFGNAWAVKVTDGSNSMPTMDGATRPGYTTLVPVTAGGLTMHCSGPLAATNNATSVKASAGQVYGLQVFNVTATVIYLKLYDKASAPAPASDTPVKVIPIPANTAVGGAIIKWEQGVQFSTGIAYAVVTGLSSTDNTAVAVNSGVVNIDYK